jgi:hypothetical protein
LVEDYLADGFLRDVEQMLYRAVDAVHDRDEETHDDNEIWISDGEAGHGIEFLG